MESLRRIGRGVVKTVTLVLIVGAAIGLGWFVWQSKNNTNKSLTNTAETQNPVVGTSKTTNTETVPKTTETITTDWTPVASLKGKLSLSYLKTWVQPTNRDLCNPSFFDRSVYLGPDADSVLKCGSEYFGQMAVQSFDGDKRSDFALGTGYKDITDKEVNVSGLTGRRISGVASAPAPGAGPGPVEGTIEVRYVFYSPTAVTYVVRYTQAPKGHAPSTNVLNDFDLMVAKTLKFSS